MRECLLCKRDMKTSKATFGNTCVRNIYTFLDLKMPRKVSIREEELYKSIMEICDIKNLDNNQKLWLVDRYLTYQYLNKIPYGDFENMKEELNADIQNIKQLNPIQKPKSANRVALKQVYDLYKKVMKFQNGIHKIAHRKFKDEESLVAIITSISFIFNVYKKKNQFGKSAFKAMQFVFWQVVIEVARNYADLPISADFLEHSLEKNPKDLIIKEGKVIDEIKKDKSFQKNINDIIKIYGKGTNSFEFDSVKDESFPMDFNDKDLYFALHSVSLKIKGNKNHDKWNLEIRIEDQYDYSQEKRINQYYTDTNSISKSILSSTLYNLGSLSNRSGVMKEYEISITFFMNDVEVN